MLSNPKNEVKIMGKLEDRVNKMNFNFDKSSNININHVHNVHNTHSVTLEEVREVVQQEAEGIKDKVVEEIGALDIKGTTVIIEQDPYKFYYYAAATTLAVIIVGGVAFYAFGYNPFYANVAAIVDAPIQGVGTIATMGSSPLKGMAEQFAKVYLTDIAKVNHGRYVDALAAEAAKMHYLSEGEFLEYASGIVKDSLSFAAFRDVITARTGDIGKLAANLGLRTAYGVTKVLEQFVSIGGNDQAKKAEAAFAVFLAMRAAGAHEINDDEGFCAFDDLESFVSSGLTEYEIAANEAVDYAGDFHNVTTVL